MLPTLTARADVQSDLACVTAAPRSRRERAPRTAVTTCPRLHELSPRTPPRAAATPLRSSVTSFAFRARREVEAAGSAQGVRGSP